MSEKLTIEQFRIKFPEKAGKHLYPLKGCCASLLEFDCDTQNDTICNLVIHDSCPGNSAAVAKLVDGMSIVEVIRHLEGIDCKKKGTSCPDQIAKSLKQYLKDRETKENKDTAPCR